MEEIRNKELSDGVMFLVTGGVAGYEDCNIDPQVISGGGAQVISGGTVTDTTVSGGGAQVISGGGAVNYDTVHSGGTLPAIS